MAEGLGRVLRELHGLSPGLVDGLSAGSGWSALAREIDHSVNTGKVVPSSLPDPYCRYEAKRLQQIWVEGRPETEDLVLCHGNPLLSHFFFDGDDFVGTDYLDGFMVADRHLDLAIVQREIHQILGAEAVFGFYDAYGTDPDLLRIDHYLLGSLLR